MLEIDSRPSAHSTTITITAAALLAIGTVMVFSAGASLTAPPITVDTLKNPAVRQAMFSFIALVTLLLVGLCPYHRWRFRRGTWLQPTLAVAAIAVALSALVLVEGIGEVRNGARRWLPLGPESIGLGFQPSEIGKIAVVLFMAAFCERFSHRVSSFWTGYLPAMLFLATMAGLVGIEDFGTAALMALVGACMLLAAGAKWWHLFITSLPGLVGVVHLVLLKEHRMRRLLTFLDPERDAQGAGYQQIQSLLTIASGGWSGRGLGAGIQKYGYLPEGRTDFIFAVICEELGIIGGIAVISLFAILLWQGKRVMDQSRTEFGRLLALGATLMIGMQAAMNVAVVTVSVPTKGISLPLISAGGTGVIILSVLVGLLVNVARYRPAGLLPDEIVPMCERNWHAPASPATLPSRGQQPNPQTAS